MTLPLLCLAAVIIFTAVLMNYTRLGRQVYAMGGNRDAASRLGLNLLKLHFYVYGYMGILAGVAAVVQAQITQSVAPNSLLGFELTVLAAVVLGGPSMSGGLGTLTGARYVDRTPARRGSAGLLTKWPDAAQRLLLLAHRVQRCHYSGQH